MILDLTRQFLSNSTLGLFGAGHLGRTIAKGLLDVGPRGIISPSVIEDPKRLIMSWLSPV